MKCTKCGSEKTKVTQTIKTSKEVQRRRRCGACGNNFHSVERVVGVKKEVKVKLSEGRLKVTVPTKDKAMIDKMQVEARRRVEDRRSKIPDYFVEDDFDEEY